MIASVRKEHLGGHEGDVTFRGGKYVADGRLIEQQVMMQMHNSLRLSGSSGGVHPGGHIIFGGLRYLQTFRRMRHQLIVTRGAGGRGTDHNNVAEMLKFTFDGLNLRKQTGRYYQDLSAAIIEEILEIMRGRQSVYRDGNGANLHLTRVAIVEFRTRSEERRVGKECGSR